VSIIRCAGHHFQIYIKDLGGGLQGQGGWICQHCKLTVKTLKAAEYLEGKPS
jgi:hypothetical protein